MLPLMPHYMGSDRLSLSDFWGMQCRTHCTSFCWSCALLSGMCTELVNQVCVSEGSQTIGTLCAAQSNNEGCLMRMGSTYMHLHWRNCSVTASECVCASSRCTSGICRSRRQSRTSSSSSRKQAAWKMSGAAQAQMVSAFLPHDAPIPICAGRPLMETL